MLTYTMIAKNGFLLVKSVIFKKWGHMNILASRRYENLVVPTFRDGTLNLIYEGSWIPLLFPDNSWSPNPNKWLIKSVTGILSLWSQVNLSCKKN